MLQYLILNILFKGNLEETNLGNGPGPGPGPNHDTRLSSEYSGIRHELSD